MMLRRHLHFFTCESALPAICFVDALVRPLLRALLAIAPMRLDVVRQDFEHVTVNHLLSLRRYRVGMKLLVATPDSKVHDAPFCKPIVVKQDSLCHASRGLIPRLISLKMVHMSW